MNISAQYISNWEEGDVTTSCKVNLITGKVTEIETSSEHDHFEHHEYDEVDVVIDDIHFQALVEDEQIAPQDLEKLQSAASKALDLSLAKNSGEQHNEQIQRS